MITDSLLLRFLSGECTIEEQAKVKSWIKASEANQIHLDELKSFFHNETDSTWESRELSEDWSKLESRLTVSKIQNPSSKRISSWIIRAAAVIILVFGSVLIFNLQKDEVTIRGTSDVPVASVLPDGSEVFLSKGSSLVYTKDFNNPVREVKIFGDAYFNVISNSENPFTVHTDEAKIKVTGTSFHVSAPKKQDHVEVIVRSGKVLFYNSETYSENSFKVDLGPGDKGTYSSKLNQLNKSHNSNFRDLSWNIQQ